MASDSHILTISRAEFLISHGSEPHCEDMKTSDRYKVNKDGYGCENLTTKSSPPLIIGPHYVITQMGLHRRRQSVYPSNSNKVVKITCSQMLTGYRWSFRSVFGSQTCRRVWITLRASSRGRRNKRRPRVSCSWRPEYILGSKRPKSRSRLCHNPSASSRWP